MVWRSVDEGIEYKVIVVDTVAEANKAATLLGEAEYIFQDRKKVLMDAFGRVDGKYGRKLTIDFPNNGAHDRGVLVRQRRIVIAAGPRAAGWRRIDSPEMARFVDSITILSGPRRRDDALELPLPK
jgi:hypothetical protein